MVSQLSTPAFGKVKPIHAMGFESTRQIGFTCKPQTAESPSIFTTTRVDFELKVSDTITFVRFVLNGGLMKQGVIVTEHQM